MMNTVKRITTALATIHIQPLGQGVKIKTKLIQASIKYCDDTFLPQQIMTLKYRKVFSAIDLASKT